MPAQPTVFRNMSRFVSNQRNPWLQLDSPELLSMNFRRLTIC